MIVCPGGSYTALASNHEGRQVAAFLNSLGVAAFVLRYRLGPKYHHPVEIGDARRALRTLRAHAGDWRLDPARIGIIGFSAGGHLAMSASILFDAGNPSAGDIVDRASSRPDIVVLGYPVISMTASWTHAGSKRNLLGESADPELARQLSGEQVVTKETPPTFIFQTNEDLTVPAENSLHYFLALRRAGVRGGNAHLRRARMASGSRTTTRHWPPGPRCSPTGCGSDRSSSNRDGAVRYQTPAGQARPRRCGRLRRAGPPQLERWQHGPLRAGGRPDVEGGGASDG